MTIKYKYTIQIIPNTGSTKDIDKLEQLIKDSVNMKDMNILGYEVISISQFYWLAMEIILLLTEQEYREFMNYLYNSIADIKILNFMKELIPAELIDLYYIN